MMCIHSNDEIHKRIKSLKYNISTVGDDCTVVLMYDCTSELQVVDAARCYLFAKKSRGLKTFLQQQQLYCNTRREPHSKQATSGVSA